VSLNKARGRKGKRKGTGRPTNLPLMAGGPSGRKEGKGKGGNGGGLKWVIYCLNWRPRLEGKRGGGGRARRDLRRRRVGRAAG
jgi:hypothetical protein